MSDKDGRPRFVGPSDDELAELDRVDDPRDGDELAALDRLGEEDAQDTDALWAFDDAGTDDDAGVEDGAPPD